MSGDDPDRPWLDELGRDHECGPSLLPYRSVDLMHEGTTVRISLPDCLDYPERLEIRLSLVSDRHLALIARHAGEDDGREPRVILLVARRRDNGTYVVHVWHELFPESLKSLGLADSNIDEPTPIR